MNAESEQGKFDLETIFDSVPAWIFYKDRDNRFLRVNKTFCNDMEISKTELEGRSLFDVFPREQAEAYWLDDKEVMGSGRPKMNIVESVQVKGENKWFRTDKLPYRDRQGDIIGILGFAVDITGEKNAKDELQAAYAVESSIRRANEHLVEQLRSALERIRTLDAILPVCAVCKKIRDKDGRWHYLESYISSHTNTEFSHGYCPDCARKAAVQTEGLDRKTE